jgi:hypothetical protein
MLSPPTLKSDFQKIEALCNSILVAKNDRHPYSGILNANIGLEDSDFCNFVNLANSAFLKGLITGQRLKRIPPIVHRVWITDPDRPHKPPDRYIQNIAQEAASITDWQLIFWTNVDSLGQAVAGEMRAAGAVVDNRNLTEAMAGEPLLEVINKYVAHQKYVSASDIARMLILRKEGGLYADMGVQTSRILFDMIDHCAWMLNIDKQGMFQINALAAPAQDPFLELWCNICHDPQPLAAIFHPAGRGTSAIEELSLLSSPGFTAMVLIFFSPSAPILIVPQQSHCLVISSQKSWYGEHGKFGNVIVSKTSPTRLDAQRHDQLRSAMHSRIADANKLGPTGFAILINDLYK